MQYLFLSFFELLIFLIHSYHYYFSLINDPSQVMLSARSQQRKLKHEKALALTHVLAFEEKAFQENSNSSPSSSVTKSKVNEKVNQKEKERERDKDVDRDKEMEKDKENNEFVNMKDVYHIEVEVEETVLNKPKASKNSKVKGHKNNNNNNNNNSNFQNNGSNSVNSNSSAANHNNINSKIELIYQNKITPVKSFGKAQAVMSDIPSIELIAKFAAEKER